MVRWITAVASFGLCRRPVSWQLEPMILFLFALVAAGQSFSCRVVDVHDGDTMRCADGTRIRLQGIDANEMDGTCHERCANLPAQNAKWSLEHLALGKSATCRSTGMSYTRVTAWCFVTPEDGAPIDLSCEQVMRQAAVIWRKYDAKHRLDRCAAALPLLPQAP
jgi:endonuclease YncB( thermonuclease family)